jgi:hypothetical protein
MNVTGIFERFGNNTWWSSWFEPIQVSNLTQVKVDTSTSKNASSSSTTLLLPPTFSGKV